MDLLQIFRRFETDESGAVTVDWVVLTAAIVGLGFVVVTTVGNGMATQGTGLGNYLDSRTSTEMTFVQN